VVWLEVPFEETARRMAVRDRSPADPTHPALRRYVEAQRTYFTTRTPWARADVVVDNSDWSRPFVVDPVRVSGDQRG
jgi:uridine kinase